MNQLYSHYNASASFYGINLSLEIDPKTDIIGSAKITDSKIEFKNELDVLLSFIKGKNIHALRKLGRNEIPEMSSKEIITPVALSLLNKALDSYLGEDVYLKERSDVLCLCYNVTKKNLKEFVLADIEFDLTKLLKNTMATSACGSCLKPINAYIAKIRSENGLIKGLKNSRARFDKEGHWIKINELYPADLMIKLDDLKNDWIAQNEIPESFSLEITDIEGNHVDMKMNIEDEFRRNIFTEALTEYYKEKTGTLFFLHITAL